MNRRKKGHDYGFCVGPLLTGMATFSISIAFYQPQKGCVGSLKLSQYRWTYVTNLPCFLFRTEFCISILVQNSNPGVVRSLLSLTHGCFAALGETVEILCGIIAKKNGKTLHVFSYLHFRISIRIKRLMILIM